MPEEYAIPVKMKMGILHTIAKSIYASPQGKIREAVANAVDNNAKKFLIFADRPSATLSLFDDGTGISEAKFKEIFANLGYGLDKPNPSSLSYFGLGLMSIIQLGKKATIYSKIEGGAKLIVLSVNVEKIFDKQYENEDVSFLGSCIETFPLENASREENSIIKDSYIENSFGYFPSTFTEIVVEGIHTKIFDYIASLSCKSDLQKLLPVSVKKNEDFIEKMTDNVAKEKIISILNDPDYCPTIDVFYGVEDELVIEQIWKYFPQLKRNLRYHEVDFIVEKKSNFAAYIIKTTEDLEDTGKDSTETGFWVRNRNFLVKPADFLEQPGSRKKIIHEPLKNWIFGEIFHKNMNDFLVVARDDYVWDSQGFSDFKDEISSITEPLNAELRKAWAASNKIVKAIISPFLEIHSPKGPFERAAETLKQMGAVKDISDIDTLLKRFEERTSGQLNEYNKIEELLSGGVASITLADDKEGLVQIVASLAEGYIKKWDTENERIVVEISPKIFGPKTVIFLGKTFQLHFVAGKNESTGISIDIENALIQVNPFNQQLMKYSISFLDVYVAIELADALSDSKMEMKDYLVNLLGRKFNDATKYLGALGDDLRRKSRRS